MNTFSRLCACILVLITFGGVGAPLVTLAGAEPLERACPRILGLSHVAVKATDYEKSVAFYRDFLGFAEQGRLFYLNNGRRELVFLKISDTQTIEVFDAANVTQVAGQLYQVALQVEDADAVRVHLAQNGFRMPPVVALGQMKNANFTTRDPNGYIIEVVQYLPEGRMIQDRGKFMPSTRISSHLISAQVLTTKLNETLHCYCDVLGLSESWRGAATPTEPACIDLKIPGSPDYIEIILGKSDAAQAFRLEVADVDQAAELLKRRARDANYEKPIVPVLGRSNHRMLTVFDPDGIKVELVETNVMPPGGTVSGKSGVPVQP